MLMALARNSLSCLKSLVSWAAGTAVRPEMITGSAITLTGSAACADPSAAAIGVAKTTIAPASAVLVASDTVTMVGAMASMSRSARIKQAATPNSPMAATITNAVAATANTPKSRGSRIRATTAVMRMLTNLSISVVATFQRAPRRTLADSGCEAVSVIEYQKSQIEPRHLPASLAGVGRRDTDFGGTKCAD